MTRLALLTLIGCGCREAIVYDTPIPVDDTFDRVPATGATLEKYEDAAAYSAEHDGRALLILEGDTVVFETGQNGFDLADPHHLFSGTKSFSCALFESARQAGHVRADEPVRDTIPELADEAADLQVDHLLHLTSGMRQDFFGLTADGLKVEQRVDDKYQRAVEQSWKTEPGEVFEYGSAHFNVFGELITRKLGTDPLSHLESTVFAPIGLQTAGWIHDPDGNPALAYGAFTTVNEWAKYGALVRDDGEFLGQRILEPGLLHCATGSAANPAYGRTFWLNQEVDDDVALIAERQLEPDGPLIYNEGPADLFAAAGHDDQRLYIIPSRDLVIVRLADGSRGFKDRELLSRILD